jgi:hypothetical protein
MVGRCCQRMPEMEGINELLKRTGSDEYLRVYFQQNGIAPMVRTYKETGVNLKKCTSSFIRGP